MCGGLPISIIWSCGEGSRQLDEFRVTATCNSSYALSKPGQTHSNRSFDQSGCDFKSLYIEPDVVRATATEIYGRDRGVPFFATTIVFDRDILELFLKLYAVLEISTATLERESLLQSFSTELIARFGEQRLSLDSLSKKRISVKWACEYLIEHYAENVFLEQLARLVGLSPFHFSRVFS